MTTGRSEAVDQRARRTPRTKSPARAADQTDRSRRTRSSWKLPRRVSRRPTARARIDGRCVKSSGPSARAPGPKLTREPLDDPPRGFSSDHGRSTRRRPRAPSPSTTRHLQLSSLSRAGFSPKDTSSAGPPRPSSGSTERHPSTGEHDAERPPGSTGTRHDLVRARGQDRRPTASTVGRKRLVDIMLPARAADIRPGRRSRERGRRRSGAARSGRRSPGRRREPSLPLDRVNQSRWRRPEDSPGVHSGDAGKGPPFHRPPQSAALPSAGRASAAWDVERSSPRGPARPGRRERRRPPNVTPSPRRTSRAAPDPRPGAEPRTSTNERLCTPVRRRSSVHAPTARGTVDVGTPR